MIPWFHASCLAVLALPFAVCAQAANVGDTIEGSARVVDGDGLRIGEAEIRLFGIDAVEAEQTCRRDGRDWDCGADAEDALADLVRGKTVTCEVEDVDRYERLVSTCSLPDGRDINRAQVESGWAVAYTDFSRRYVSAENEAKNASLGIWASEFERPSDYRARLRAEARAAQPRSERASSSCAIKGNINSEGERIYHAPGQRDYERTTIREENGERWFCSEAQAAAAGWRRARR